MKKITYLIAFLFTATFSSLQAQNCNADFKPNSGGGLTVQFFDSSFSNTPNSALNYLWDFGDGQSSTMSNPTHTYLQTGDYNVCLSISDSICSDSICKMVKGVGCQAYFVAQTGSNGLASFLNHSNSSPTSAIFTWYFGDGDSSVTFLNATHYYASGGQYTATLKVNNTVINCVSYYTEVVTIPFFNNNCNPYYSVVKDSTNQFGVTLINRSSNLASHIYTWDFGDGNFGAGRTPAHTYASFGDYIVCLTIQDSILNCTSTFCDTVGMDSLGNLKSAAGFSISVIDPTLVGIEKNDSLEEVTVYPNPAVNNLSVDLRAISSKVEIRIMDISGRVVVERNNTTSGNIEQFDISSLENGLYIISLNDGQSQKTQKFIKTK
jgi:PKD repeat protein